MISRNTPVCKQSTRSGQNIAQREGEETWRTEEEQSILGVLGQVPEGSGEQGKRENTGCKVICAAPTTLMFKGLMVMNFITCG